MSLMLMPRCHRFSQRPHKNKTRLSNQNENDNISLAMNSKTSFVLNQTQVNNPKIVRFVQKPGNMCQTYPQSIP